MNVEPIQESSSTAVAAVDVSTKAPVPWSRSGALLRVAGNAHALGPYVSYGAQRLGAVGVVGVAMILFSIVAMFSANAPLREQLASDTATLERFSNSPGATPQPLPSAQAELEQFLSQLPTRDQLPALMSQIVATSASKGLDLEQGKYELVSAKAGALARYRMTFPVVGNYPQVRGFIDDALVAVPALSLDGLRLQRRNIGDGVVMADIEFAVFVRTAP